jgi:hypothetical protein
VTHDSQVHAPFVTCLDNNTRRSQVQRTSVLVSPDGKHKAYAEVSTKESAPGEPQPCANTSHLYVDGKVVYTLRSDQGHTANSLGPVAWSPDSRHLLVEAGLWDHISDTGALKVLLYNLESGKMTEPDTLSAIKRKAGRNCAPSIAEISGFDHNSRIRLWIADHGDEEGPTSYCFENPQQWSYDPATGAARRI